MAFLCLVLSVISLLAASNAQTLTRCDDCFSSRTSLRYGNIYFGGSRYRAFSVSSNGYLVLLSNSRTSIRGYSFKPTSIRQSRGSPMIAGFWSDINLACRGTLNTVRYTETCDSGLLWIISSIAQDPAFNPTSAVVVQYDAVQRYTCPSSRDTNTFTITVATDRVSRRSYVILQYERMGWNGPTSSNAPVVGYTNGRSQGYQASLTSNAAAYLNANNSLVFRVDQRFTRQVQINRGNLAALMQKPVFNEANEQQEESKEDESENVIMQNFEDKLVFNEASEQQEESKEDEPENVIMQNFEDKQVSSIEN